MCLAPFLEGVSSVLDESDISDLDVQSILHLIWPMSNALALDVRAGIEGELIRRFELERVRGVTGVESERVAQVGVEGQRPSAIDNEILPRDIA